MNETSPFIFVLRRRKDSNLRGDFSPNILAGCCLQPLGHASKLPGKVTARGTKRKGGRGFDRQENLVPVAFQRLLLFQMLLDAALIVCFLFEIIDEPVPHPRAIDFYAEFVER